MKNIAKALWLYLEFPYFFLNEKEAILRFCASDKRFMRDRTRQYEHYFIILNRRHEPVGSLVFQFNEWVCFIGDLTKPDSAINGVHSLSELKSLIKKHTR
jgi:hypothetical protein